jgi:hypothetical protein
LSWVLYTDLGWRFETDEWITDLSAVGLVNVPCGREVWVVWCGVVVRHAV